jgi:hypothetical protein
MNTYKASMDTLTKVLTIGVSILLLLAGFAPLLSTNGFQLIEWINPSPVYVMPFAFIIILLLTYGFSPKGYAITEHDLVIFRPFKNKHYPLKTLKSISLLTPEEMKWTARVFGVGGLFGYFGLFRNKRFGNMVWYASRRGNFVVLERKTGKTLVLSPDDPNSFVSSLQQSIEG